MFLYENIRITNFFCGYKILRSFETDVSGLPVGPIFKGEIISSLPIQMYCARSMGPIDSPATSVSNHLPPRNNPADGRI
jgi:hypothetical protein